MVLKLQFNILKLQEVKRDNQVKSQFHIIKLPEIKMLEIF